VEVFGEEGFPLLASPGPESRLVRNAPPIDAISLMAVP
jgi:hypothetical protein